MRRNPTKELDARLVTHLKAIAAKMPKPNPDYQPKKKGK